MQRTPNLGLPQFEPSDKYRLEDYNEAYMKIDEKVKELKDKEAQLNTKLAEAQSIIDTWTQFKNSGGNIGGAINFPFGDIINNITKPITISGNTMYYRENVTNNAGFSHMSRFEDDSLGDKVNQNGIEFRKNYGETSGSFRPMVDNALDLGSSNYKWKDIYLNGMNRNAPNGYSKLPNGLILQWVRTEVTTTGYHSIQLPLTFPTKLCGFISEIGGRDSNSNPQPIGAYGNMSGSTTSSCQIRIGALGTNNIDRVFINIIAIGY